MRSKLHDEDWREIGDPTPVEMPLNFKAPPTIHEMIKMYVRKELSQAAHNNGYETFEESNDFGEDEEEPLPRSAHEYAPEDEEVLTRALEDVKKEVVEQAARRGLSEVRKGEESERGTKGVAGKAAKGKAVAGGAAGNGKEGKGVEGSRSEDLADDRGGEEGVDGREMM